MKISDRASQVERVQGVQQKSQIVKKQTMTLDHTELEWFLRWNAYDLSKLQGLQKTVHFAVCLSSRTSVYISDNLSR